MKQDHNSSASGGLARLDWSVPDGTEAVILEFGANDALRGIDPNITRAALDNILQRLKTRSPARAHAFEAEDHAGTLPAQP